MKSYLQSMILFPPKIMLTLWWGKRSLTAWLLPNSTFRLSALINFSSISADRMTWVCITDTKPLQHFYILIYFPVWKQSAVRLLVIWLVTTANLHESLGGWTSAWTYSAWFHCAIEACLRWTYTCHLAVLTLYKVALRIPLNDHFQNFMEYIVLHVFLSQLGQVACKIRDATRCADSHGNNCTDPWSQNLPSAHWASSRWCHADLLGTLWLELPIFCSGLTDCSLAPDAYDWSEMHASR